MRTTALTLRTIVSMRGAASAFWLLPGNVHKISKIRDDEYDAVLKNNHRLVKPDNEAIWFMSAGGQPDLDTADSRYHFGDVWELLGKVAVCIGDSQDFRYSTVNSMGKGFTLESTGNLIFLEPRDYNGRLPLITLHNPIPGIRLVNGILEVDDGVQSFRKFDIDLKFPEHHSITFDAKTDGNASSTSSISFAHTTSGSERAMSATMTWDTSDGTFAATYNSVAMTTQYKTVNHRFLSQASLGAPASGSNTFAATFGLAFLPYATVISLNGVDQSTPVRGQNSATGDGELTATVTITTVADDMVVDGLRWGAAPITVGAGQIQRSSTEVQSNEWFSSSTELATGTSTTMSWTTSVSGKWGLGGIAFKPAAAAGIVGKSYIKRQAVNRASTY